MKATSSDWLPVLLVGLLVLAVPGYAGESPYLYGIFGYDLTTNPDDNPQVFLDHVAAGAGPGWVTTTVAVVSNTNDTWGVDYTPLASQGVTLICRINNGYFPNGTIPPPAKYDDFATRITNFVAHSPGCSIWSIGNELNIQGEWPTSYAILASTNLVNWDRVSTNVAPSLVTLPTTGYSLRFYRALFL